MSDNKSGKSRRPKFPGRIRELASKDAFSAMLYAQRSVEFNELQTLLNLYYQTLQKYNQLLAGKKTRDQKLLEGTKNWTKELAAAYPGQIQKMVQQDQARLCKMFLKAVDERDADTILKIGNAIKFLKSFNESGDARRAAILCFKRMLERQGEKWTIRKLAKAIDWPMEDSADGFSRLRRLCRDLNFALAPSRQISGK